MILVWSIQNPLTPYILLNILSWLWSPFYTECQRLFTKKRCCGQQYQRVPNAPALPPDIPENNEAFHQPQESLPKAETHLVWRKNLRRACLNLLIYSSLLTIPDDVDNLWCSYFIHNYREMRNPVARNAEDYSQKRLRRRTGRKPETHNHGIVCALPAQQEKRHDEAP